VNGSSRTRGKWLTRMEFLEHTAKQDETTVEEVLRTYNVVQCPCIDARCLGWRLETPTQATLW
jgi:hypothetical protein